MITPEVYSSLLIAEFSEYSYANGCIIEGLIATPAHVARGNPKFFHLFSNSEAFFNFHWSADYDLAVATYKSKIRGMKYLRPNVGDEVQVIGHHGPDRNLFSISSIVVDLNEYGQVIVERKHRGEKFQVGMSGSPGVLDNAAIGILARGANQPDTRALLEPLDEFLFQALGKSLSY